MRDHGRDAERGEQRVHEQARADAGDREPPVAAAAAQGVPHDEEGVGAGHHRHERRDERECEDLRIDEVHDLPVSEAVDRMVVDDADGLHECVADRRADEAEAAALQFLAERVGQQRAAPAPGRGERSRLSRGSPPTKSPEECIEASELALDLQERGGVRDGALDLEAIAHDPGSRRSFARRAAVNRATFAGSKSAKARR